MASIGNTLQVELTALFFYTATAVLAFFLLIKFRILHHILSTIASTKSYKKWFAQVQSQWSQYPEAVISQRAIRGELFAEIGARLKELGGDLYEIGISTGRNLAYMNLPEKSSLVAVDYNPHMEKFLRENLKKYPAINFKEFIVQGSQDMSEIPDNSVSVLVATQLLCSMDEEAVKKSLQEFKRVLKPGGYYFFMEHVKDEPWTIRSFLQLLSSSITGFMPMFLDGCCSDRETWNHLYNAGFSRLSYKKGLAGVVRNWKDPFFTCLVYLTRTKMWGFAQKTAP